MKKSDLKTGMIVECRNGELYMVLIGTGCKYEDNNILWRAHGFWMPLSNYSEDMLNIPDDDKTDFLKISKEKQAEIAREFDIIKVYQASCSAYIGSLDRCKLVYDRNEEGDE